MNSETEEIMMIKDHLKEVAEYYSQSFFEKTNMEGMGMEDIIRQMAEYIQHNEQCITSIMDLVGLLILKCDVFFKLQEENEQQIQDINEQYVQQLEFERQNTEFERLTAQQFQQMYKDSQEKANSLLDNLTNIENKFVDQQGQRQKLKEEHRISLMESENQQKQVDQVLIESIQFESGQIINTLKMKNQNQLQTIETFENAVQQFSDLKDELTDQIEKLTHDYNCIKNNHFLEEKSNNRILMKSNDALSEEIKNQQINHIAKLQQMKFQSPTKVQRPSFMNTLPTNNLSAQRKPSFIGINAYTQLLSKDITNLIPSNLKIELQNHFLPEDVNSEFYLNSRKHTILPSILSQQLQTLNPQLIANAFQQDTNTIVSESSECSDAESVGSRASISSSQSIRNSAQVQKELFVKNSSGASNFKPKIYSRSRQQTQEVPKEKQEEGQVELIPRTQSTFHGPNPQKNKPEGRQRVLSYQKKVNIIENLYKKPRDQADSLKQRLDPYKEFFILVKFLCYQGHHNALNSILRNLIKSQRQYNLYNNKIDSIPLLELALSRKIPFNEWYVFIKRELENKVK